MRGSPATRVQQNFIDVSAGELAASTTGLHPAFSLGAGKPVQPLSRIWLYAAEVVYGMSFASSLPPNSVSTFNMQSKVDQCAQQHEAQANGGATKSQLAVLLEEEFTLM